MPSRNRSTPAPRSTPESLDELLVALTQHGQDFELGEPLWRNLAARGHEVIPDLLERSHGDKPFIYVDRALQKILGALHSDLRGKAIYLLERSLESTVPRARRIAAIGALRHVSAGDPRVHDCLISIAVKDAEEPEVRRAACETLSEMKPEGIQAERLLEILDASQDKWLRDESWCKAVFLCLRRHALQIPCSKLLQRLEPLLTHENPRYRESTIELIGAFGDVDIVEHLFALPDAGKHRAQILEAAAAIARRPINLLTLRPEAFEAVITRFLRRMGYHDVSLTGGVGDRGVDAVCHVRGKRFAEDEENQKVIVQYKRYRDASIDDRTIQNFDEAVRTHHAHQGLFITASDYTKPALAFAASRKYLELISGQRLVERLNGLFADNRYTIRVPT